MDLELTVGNYMLSSKNKMNLHVDLTSLPKSFTFLATTENLKPLIFDIIDLDQE